MQSKVCYYNEFTHIIVVDYKGVRIQFTTDDYNKGDKTVNVLRNEKGYFISNESAEYSVYIMQLFRTFSAGHPEIRCSDSGCQCSPL